MSGALSETESFIPVIDVGPLLAGVPGAARALAKDVTRTCLDTGFLVITNHGVHQDIIDRAFAAAATFFAQNEAAKLALKVGGENIGYLPYGFAETLLTWKKDSKDIKQIKQILATPNTESSAVFITYKIGS